MTKEIVKKGYDLAQKEVEAKELERVKQIVLETLKRIEEFQGDVRELKAQKEEELKRYDAKIAEREKEIKLLKLDIEDLKAGKLERIEERQKLDPKAKELGVFIIERIERIEKIIEPGIPYPVPYPVNPIPPYNPWATGPIWVAKPNIYCTETSDSIPAVATFCISSDAAREGTIGCYVVADGKTVNIR